MDNPKYIRVIFPVRPIMLEHAVIKKTFTMRLNSKVIKIRRGSPVDIPIEFYNAVLCNPHIEVFVSSFPGDGRRCAAQRREGNRQVKREIDRIIKEGSA